VVLFGKGMRMDKELWDLRIGSAFLKDFVVTNSVLSSANEKHAYDCGLGQTCELGAGTRDVAGSIDRMLEPLVLFAPDISLSHFSVVQ
jgi:hypothetical protein